MGGSNHSHATADLQEAIAVGDYPEWTLCIQTMEIADEDKYASQDLGLLLPLLSSSLVLCIVAGRSRAGDHWQLVQHQTCFTMLPCSVQHTT